MGFGERSSYQGVTLADALAWAGDGLFAHGPEVWATALVLALLSRQETAGRSREYPGPKPWSEPR
jgi:hypothetical protein